MHTHDYRARQSWVNRYSAAPPLSLPMHPPSPEDTMSGFRFIVPTNGGENGSDGSVYRDALTTENGDATAAVEPPIFVIRLLRAAKWAVR